jgi:hypothetical protein
MTTPSAFSDDADAYDSSVIGGGQNTVFIQRFKNPETRLRLCQEPNSHPNQMKTIREHYSTRFRESFACPNHRDNGVPCVGCADPDSKTRKRNRRFITNAINDRGELILIKMGPDLHKKFVNKRQRLGTVLNCDWIVVKTGTGLNTDYEPWPGEEYPVPMPTELIDINAVIANQYNTVAARYLSSVALAGPPYGNSPFVDQQGFAAQPQQNYGPPAGYAPTSEPSFGGYGAPQPAQGRITPAYAQAAPPQGYAPQQPPQGFTPQPDWPPPVGQPPTPPPNGQPPAPGVDPWSQQPGAPMGADPWTQPPPPNDPFVPRPPDPPIQPQYAQPQQDPRIAPWDTPQSLANAPLPADGSTPGLFGPAPGAVAQAAPAPPAVAASPPAAPPVPEPAAASNGVPQDNGSSNTPVTIKDMTIKELRAWLSDPERGVEFPAQAARSRLVKLAEEWQTANPE